MAEIAELERLEDQLYQYHPELRLDSEELKLERRNRLFMQLQSSQPEVQLVALDAVSSLTNIKSMLEKCKDVVLDYSHIISPPAMSSIESSGDEFLGTQRPRRTATRKRRTTSIQYNGSEVSKYQCGRKDDSPLSLSILIPQVVKGSEKMEISIDLGELDTSQRLFASRVDELLRKRSNSSHQIEDAPSKENLNSNKCKDFHLPVATSSTIETINENTEKPEDEMLSRLISQVLVENQETETLQATNLLDNINNNERSNYSADVPDPVESSKEQLVKKKRQRKSKKSAHVEKGPPKKRGRKPKNKPEKQGSIEYAEMAKSDLAKYVELFSNTCNMAGSVTPAASSTISQQLVTSTTHYLDSNDQQPITYYLEGNWENGGNCLLQTDNTHIDGGQEEFNMAELVNYIDNVGDAGNAIARVLDAPATVPVLVQDSQSQSNAIVPPPAHVSDVLLDLSKRSTISYSQTAPPINNVPIETDHQDLMPLDLSLKSSKLIQKSVHNNSNLTPLVTNFNNNGAGKLNETTEGVFGEHDYGSYRAALDMPLIDLEDNINAFMQLTNNEAITAAPTAENTSTDCALLTKETANNPLPICDIELGEILSETTLCNNNYNHNSQYNSKTNDLNSNVVKNGENALDQIKVNDTTTNIERLMNKTANANEHPKTVEVGVYESLTQRNCDATCSQNSDGEQWLEELSVAKENKGNTASNTETKVANVAENSENKAEYSSNVGGIGHIDELHGDSGDLLFVDTETLVANKSKSSFDRVVSATQLDTPREYFAANEVSRTTNANEQGTGNNEDVACDLSTKANQIIDLEEDHQSHDVSVHLEIPQLPQLESNSEEFTYDYETALESIEDKDTAVNTVAESTQQPVGTQQYTEENNANESQKNDNLSCNDSGIGNSVVGNVCESAEVVAKPTLTLLTNNNHSTVSNFITEEAPEMPTKSTGNVDTNMNIESDEGKEQTDNFAEGKSIVEDSLSLKDFASCCNQQEANTVQAQITATKIGNETESCREKDEDADISYKPESVNAYSASETEAEDLKQTNHRKGNESFSQSAEVSLEGPQDVCIKKMSAVPTHHNALEADQKQAIEGVLDNVKAKQPDTNRNLSVLEMELKMDDDCLDFDDEMEDDALSLATSCFNSSDDERCPDMDPAPVADFKSVNKNENRESMQVVHVENEEMVDDKSTVVKVEATQCSTHVSSDILKKFKIPKISMTTATAKHASPAEDMSPAGALPMVIVPTNVIKTERDAIKTVNLEKITRTVQNVCAVTPLTQQQPAYQPQTTASTQISFDTIKPLMSDILQLPSSSNKTDVKNLKTVNDNTQISCLNGELAANSSDGWNTSRRTIAIARTFGVTCLPFLVGRCFKLGNCEFSHTFRESETVGNILLTFSEVDLNIAYRFAYNHENLFRRYMHEFCRAYSARNNRIKLLHMARDCVRYHDGNKLLMTIFHSLEYCGLNKINACRQILIYSQDRSQATIDVLLEIIFEANWTMFCDHIEKFVDVAAYKFRVKVLNQMASTILEANDQRMTSLFFKCLVNLDSNDVGLVQTSPILMQLLELIKSGQICR